MMTRLGNRTDCYYFFFHYINPILIYFFRHQHDTINPSLPHIQIIEGHFIYYNNNNDSDDHLFAKEDFEKHDTILN